MGIKMSSIIFGTYKRIFYLIVISIRHPILIYKTNKSGMELLKKDLPKGLTYEIPRYDKDFKYCDSKNKYLRSVYLCEIKSPEIISMANKLGSFQISDKKYAENVFDFVKNNIKTKNIPVKGAVETLKQGCGSCFDSAGLFITLCRCGGIPARYKIYIHHNPPEGFSNLSEVSDKRLLGGLAIIAAFYTVAEIKIDDKWIECEVSSPPELDAYWNVPIAHFGENCGNVGSWFPDKILYFEKLPRRIVIPTNIMMKRFRGIMASINQHVEQNWKEGKKKLEKIGRKEYDKKARRRYGFFPSVED